MKKHHRGLSSFGSVSVALALIILICSSQIAAAQDLKAQVRSLRAVFKENKTLVNDKDEPVSTFFAYLDKLMEVKSDLGASSVTISAAGCFDNGRYSAGAVDVKTSIARDLYPHTLRFEAASKFMFSPASVQNELTSILINYDHYLSKKVELYGFIQRFSDSFMSIKQRYESGLGIKLEFDAQPHKRALSGTSSAGPIDIQTGRQRQVATLEEYLKLRNEFIGYIQKSGLSREDKETIYQGLSIIDRERKDTEIAVIKKESPFTWGLALSFLSEVEQAEIDTGTVDPETQKNIIVLIDPSQFFRLSVRPSFRWQLSDTVSLNSQFYWKPSLRKTGFLKDSRLDIISKMNFIVAKDFLWGGPASVSVDYQFHYDWMPPMIPSELIQSYVDRGITLRFDSGAKFHHYYAVNFSISF